MITKKSKTNDRYMQWLALIFLASMALLATSGSVKSQESGWLQSPVNGRWYRLTPPGAWWDSESFARARSANLATIRSQDEKQWLMENMMVPVPTGAVPGDVGIWIGLRGAMSVAPGYKPGFCVPCTVGSLSWISGEPASTTIVPFDHGCAFCGFINQCYGTYGVLLASGSFDLVENQAGSPCQYPPGVIEVASLDCNSNGIPDVSEMRLGIAADCDNSAIIDSCEIALGLMADCDSNMIPDLCELSGGSLDCNGNQILDVCDAVAAGGDCNANGLLDVCETAAGTVPDCNLNSRPDACDLAAGAPDCNLNQVPDSCDIGTGASLDGDFNNIPDECSLDCNGNGLLDSAECAQGLVADCNANLVPDTCDIAGAVPDCNANGVPDSCDIALGGDCNGNNTPDSCDLAAGAPDCNGNGLLDACDLAAGAADCDGNLVPDVCQPVDASNDCNANLVLDVCDILAGAPDCNANGRPDSCEADTNNDGVPDDCQDGGTPFCFGDGTANSTPCPCGGVGAPRSGCPNSANPLGGYLEAIGLPSRSADTLVLRGSQMPPVATVLYFQGTSQATAAGGTIGTVFGDGLRCASGAVLRLGFRTNVGGASELPSGGSPALHIVGQIPASGAVTRYYQGWYRDASSTFCTTNRYNLTNGVAVVWVP